MTEVYSQFIMKRLWVAALCCLLPVHAAGPRTKRKPPLAASITRLITSSRAASSAFWGIQIVELGTGKAVYQQNADKFFVPASNTKLFSTALALHALGPDYRFVTKVLGSAAAIEGVLAGDLRLAGGGDPNLSGRTLPYAADAENGDPLAVIHKLADAVAASGIRRITGDVLGDDTLYPHEPFPPGWGLGDPVEEYGAPVSALSVNDNAVKLTVTPGAEAGDPVQLSLHPPVEYFAVRNDMRTVETGMAFPDVNRTPGTRQLLVSGTLLKTARPRTYRLAVEDPALFAAFLLHDALEQRGVRVDGEPRAAHRDPETTYSEPQGIEIARHESAPLKYALQVVNKESQNLHAELMLRAAARANGGSGSRTDGLKALDAFLRSIGVPPKSYDFYDGSGLSRLTLVKPAVVTSVLQWLHANHWETLKAALPVAGQDGTLKLRFAGAKGAEAILAKTGSLTHVTALGGFVTGSRREYAFSIVVNNFAAPAGEIRSIVDKIVLLLLN